MDLITTFITGIAHFAGLVIAIGSKALNKFWHFIKPGIRRIYIFFATPNVVVYYEEIPNFRPAKSEAELAIEKLVEKLKRNNKPKDLKIRTKVVDDKSNI